MNVSISAVVRDLDTTVSGVQSAVALETLVSAAFILIGKHIAQVLEDDAEVMSDTRLEEQLAGEPPEIQEEIVSINEDARPEALRSPGSCPC